MKYVVDTNVLLDLPSGLDKYNLVITSIVLDELEKHKLSMNPDLAYKARRAIRFIRENEHLFEFEVNDYYSVDTAIEEVFDPTYADTRLIQCCKQNNFGLLTNDMSLRLKARTFNIDVISIDSNAVYESYSGYKEITATDEELSYLYSNLDHNVYDLLINQYLIIKDQDGNTVDIYRWNGEKHVKLRHPTYKDLGNIKPKNDLQKCAIDLLYNKNIPVKVVAGTYGSGKTFLTVTMALWHIDNGNYAKLLLVRNPIGKGERIGYLKGDKKEKTEDFFRPIAQYLPNGQEGLDKDIRDGKIEADVPFFMKGLSIGQTFMLVDEAEDLDVKIVELLGTRIEKDSCIVFCGDYKQAESKYAHNNGLLKMIDKLKGNPLVGIIVLDEDVRSEASKLFVDLD